MDKIRNCTVCNMKLDVGNYLKHRNVCKTCYKKNRRKNNDNTSHQNQNSKVLITITISIKPQTSSDKVRNILDVIKSRFPKVLEPRFPISIRP